MVSESVERDSRSQDDLETQRATENTPLIAREDVVTQAAEQSRPQNQRSVFSALFSRLRSSGKGARRRWPSILALFFLCILAVLIMVFAFFAPSVVEQYAQQAVTFEPTSLSIEGFTTAGVSARVQGDFYFDADKVQSKSVRDLGRFGTWIARKAQSGESKVEVTLPEHDNVLLGTAYVPPIVVNLRDGEVTHVDFVADLEAGSIDGIRRIAGDWIEGRLGQLRVLGKADVPIKSGIFSFGVQKVTHELLFANKDIPEMPAYKIKKLNIHEIDLDSGKGMAADVSLQVKNKYPVDFTVPSLGFDISVDGCRPSDPNIMLADATTQPIGIHPKTDVELNVTGIVPKLPDMLTQACPGSGDSPLDQLLGSYIRGQKTTIYVQGADRPVEDTPAWVKDILSSITVPVDVPGRSFGGLIKNFSMADTSFKLPSPFAEPNSPESQPRISATVQAIIAVPEEMNFELSVDKVRANAEVYYKNKELGTIALKKWQPAKSKRVEAKPGDEGPTLLVESKITDVPLNITDDDVLSDVISELLMGQKDVIATLKANVDVSVDTALGAFTVRKIPAEGKVPIKPINDSPSAPGRGRQSTPADMLKALSPKIYDISVVSTTSSSLTISALVNITNPTAYSADIPYLSLHAFTNDSILANASVQDIKIRQGNNTALRAVATWNPQLLGGKTALDAGIQFMSQYISGYNTTLTVRMHEQSIPALPALGRALSKLNITVPTPRLPDVAPPQDGDEDDPDDGPRAPKFIDQARFHLFSSSADFVLRSPLPHDILTITKINATATYKGSRIGQIQYDEPFEVEPVNEEGEGSLTPRLPVDWDTGSVGWDAVRRALGGRLKIAAEAVVSIAIGEWRLDDVWFKGHGLGVGVRP